MRASGQHVRLLAIVSGSSYGSYSSSWLAPTAFWLLRSFVNNAVVGKQIARANKYSNNISARTSNKVKQTRALSAWMLFFLQGSTRMLLGYNNFIRRVLQPDSPRLRIAIRLLATALVVIDFLFFLLLSSAYFY